MGGQRTEMSLVRSESRGSDWDGSRELARRSATSGTVVAVVGGVSASGVVGVWTA
jgi:hypothetical protein